METKTENNNKNSLHGSKKHKKGTVGAVAEKSPVRENPRRKQSARAKKVILPPSRQKPEEEVVKAVPVHKATGRDKVHKSEADNKEILSAAVAEQSAAKTRKQKGGRVKQAKNAVKIIFLGGVGEIGKNMTAIECGNDIIVIDAGIIFPTEETPGIDLIAPDVTYLKDNEKKLRGLLLTHGHEDHIGGVPYLLKEVNIPVS